MLKQLRQQLRSLEKPTGIDDGPGALPLGVATVDEALGGGLAPGALHEIAAVSEAHLPAATGFALGLISLRNCVRAATLSSPLPLGEVGARSAPSEGLRPHESHLPPHPISRSLSSGRPERAGLVGSVDLSPQGRGERKRALVWIAEDMALAESGAPYGPGLDAFGLHPERLLTVAVARPRDLLWAMEEALRCRTVRAVIGEWRHGAIDMVTQRRLSLAATESGTLALLLRASPADDASTAATRWIVGVAPVSFAGGSHPLFISVPSPSRSQSGFALAKQGAGIQNDPSNRHSNTGFPLSRGRAEDSFAAFAVQLVRNRRGPTGSWILEWSDSDERFLPATPAQPVAAPAVDRPHRQIVQQVA